MQTELLLDMEPLPARPDLLSYDHYVVCFSGGKDSLACALFLIEQGVPSEKIELHHHEIDGRESPMLMDWPQTPEYCRAVARELGLVLRSSWKVGGFEREMLRHNAKTAPTAFETERGIVTVGGTSGKNGTRLKFPQVSADLRCRWCSAYLKIDVLDKVLIHSPEYRGRRTLVVTGERAQESPNRARYATFERHRAHAPSLGRHVDHFRAVHAWSTEQVWDIIKRHGIVPHAAYYLGWGRLSCRCCIFGSANQWATIRLLAPDAFKRVANYERQFGTTIQRTESVEQLADRGTPYPSAVTMIGQADTVPPAIRVAAEDWILPAGAYGENAGPS